MIATARLWFTCALLLSLSMIGSSGAHADSVSQIATGVRISRSTAALIDPQGRPGDAEVGTDTAVRPGDILTFLSLIHI